MPFFGKDATHQHHGAHATTSLEHEGKHGETAANNVDPGRNRINPQVLSRDAFTLNSLCYGLPVATGSTSTWDRQVHPATQEFHAAMLRKYGTCVADHAAQVHADVRAAAARYGDAKPTSINNYLHGQMTGTGEGMRREDLGRQRGRDTEEPAHHFEFHTPTVHDRVHGAANIVAGKIRMDQDISTRAHAEYKGQTTDGH